jgi:hypothetical protein
MNKRPEDPGPLRNESIIFPCNNLKHNKKCHDNRISGWTDRLSNTTQQRYSDAKVFRYVRKNQYRHFTTVYSGCTCHWVGYNNGSLYLQLFIIS